DILSQDDRLLVSEASCVPNGDASHGRRLPGHDGLGPGGDTPQPTRLVKIVIVHQKAGRPGHYPRRDYNKLPVRGVDDRRPRIAYNVDVRAPSAFHLALRHRV